MLTGSQVVIETPLNKCVVIRVLIVCEKYMLSQVVGKRVLRTMCVCVSNLLKVVSYKPKLSHIVIICFVSCVFTDVLMDLC